MEGKLDEIVNVLILTDQSERLERMNESNV